MPCDTHDSSHCLRHEIESRPMRPGPRLAETRNACIDQPRLYFIQRFVVDPKPGRNAGTIVLHHNVCGFDQLIKRLAPVNS